MTTFSYLTRGFVNSFEEFMEFVDILKYVLDRISEVKTKYGFSTVHLNERKLVLTNLKPLHSHWPPVIYMQCKIHFYY